MLGKVLNLVGGPVASRFATPVVFVVSNPILDGGVGVEFGVGTVKKVLEVGVEFGLIGLEARSRLLVRRPVRPCFYQPNASVVTMQPLRSNRRNNSGMIAISSKFFAMKLPQDQPIVDRPRMHHIAALPESVS